MSVVRTRNKEEKQFAVSMAILEVLEKDGLLGVTHSKISRKSEVSRAWIYEYIGKERAALIEFAAEVFASHFSRVNLSDIPKTKQELEERLKEGIDFLFTFTEVSPVAIKIYFRFRGSTNPIGEVIQKYESRWLDTASKTLIDVLGMTSEQASLLAELILTLRVGFAHRYATSAKPEDVRSRAKQIFSFVHSLLAASV